ncbi:hypothetical protein L3C95_18630 [Chitinophaga filiformis]|uniref:hypothetical protein n=1 Tax=Chitinophaga filiformis TaxID=104663 RepID=UPI001F21C489|nr:hypothetical protein [Chitinophaga filiformis]MCF6404923.1 hypothetical protein [Chitinophaga filiformis]
MRLNIQLSIGICLLLALSVAGCRKELRTDNGLSGNYDATNGNSEEEKNASVKAIGGPYSDWSGKVSVVLVSKDVGPGDLVQGDVAVPDDYVLVGGGAYNYQGEPGSFLTASYPGSDLKTWYIESKGRPGVTPYYLACYAIGLKIQGISSAQLKDYIKLVSATSGVASKPSASASLTGTGYTLIGGGAKVNWSGAGNFLTDSHPFGTENAWYVASKDHITSAPASITAYAIGILKDIPNFGSLDIGSDIATLVPQCLSVNEGSVEAKIPQGWVLTCPGGAARYRQYGRMIIGMYPSMSFSSSSALLKTGSSQQWDCGESTVYAMRIQKTK